MEFCPTCGILLQYELPHMSRPARFFCPTCPYVCNIETKVKIKRRQHLVKKEIEPIFSKDDMKNGPTTEATCPNCGFGKAVFQQMQIRSADEPMSTFYWCLNEKCRHQWRED
ncbi:hypothetical protein ACSBR2_016453 [Camellia fascicularis]